MKVAIATNNSDLSVLKNLDEPIVVYTANKDVHQEILKIRDKIQHMTIVILDKYKRNINQVILEYGESLNERGATELEPFTLGDSDNYITPVFVVLVIIVVFLIIGLAFYRTGSKNGKTKPGLR